MRRPLPTILEQKGTEARLGGKLTLTVTDGEDRGASVVIDDASPPILVGRSPACALRLEDPGVSRRHFSLEVASGDVHLKDLGSANGTRVNRVLVLEAKLLGRETIALGKTRIAVHREADAPSAELTAETSFGGVFGHSPQMRKLYPTFERLASSRAPVLIEGETGTGKEALAEAMHARSDRRTGPFVVFDCTTVPPSLLEAQLFGHERGAFTGATRARAGVFEEANGGTLLIDEIGDLDVALQPKLLRAVERGEFRPAGGGRLVRVDVRVLCATRRDLDALVQDGRFRDDLFHRIAVTRVELPPLRRREGDVRFLAARFTRELGGDARSLDEAVLSSWDGYSWPGNVRELKNAVARYLALGDLGDFADSLARGSVGASVSRPRESGESAEAAEPHASAQQRAEVLIEGLDDLVEKVLDKSLPFDDGRLLLVAAFEREYLRRALRRADGVVTHAAAAAGMARRHFHRLMARYRIG